MSRPNPKLTEIEEYIEGTLRGTHDAPAYFVTLLNKLLTWTIVEDNQFVMVHLGPHKDRMVIAPPKRSSSEMALAAKGNEIYTTLKLRNGRFMSLRYDVFIDVAKDDFMKIIASRLSYQLDELGYKQLFRFDYARVPESNYPFSHLHVYGNWQHDDTPKLKDLDAIHFPVVRATIEGFIRLIIADFGVETNTSFDIYGPILARTEDRFLEVARKTKKTEKDFPD